MRINRSRKYLKSTKALYSKGHHRRDIEICQVDIPNESHDAIVLQHKLRDVHVVLKRLGALPDVVNVQDYEDDLPNQKTQDEPKVQLRSSPRISKQINRSDISSTKSTVFSKSNLSPSTPNVNNKKANTLPATSLAAGTSVNSFHNSRSSNRNNQKSNSNDDNNGTIVFSADESLNKSKNIKGKTSLSSATISKNALKDQTDNCLISSEKEEISKSNAKKSIKPVENKSPPNKDLTNLLPEKLEYNSDNNYKDACKAFPERTTRSSLKTKKSVEKDLITPKKDGKTVSDTKVLTVDNAEDLNSTSETNPHLRRSTRSNKFCIVPLIKPFIQKKDVDHSSVVVEKEPAQNKSISGTIECDSDTASTHKNEGTQVVSTCDNVNACSLSSSKDLSNYENNSISLKDKTNNELLFPEKHDHNYSRIPQDEEFTRQKNKKEERPSRRKPSSIPECALTKNSSYSLKKDIKKLSAFYEQNEEINLSEESGKLKEVELSFVNRKPSECGCPSPLLSSNMQNENHASSSIIIEQESKKSECEKKVVPTRPNTRLSSTCSNTKAVTAKAQPSIKSDCTPSTTKSHNLQMEKSEADSVTSNETYSKLSVGGSDNNVVEPNIENEYSSSNAEINVTSNENNDEFPLPSAGIGNSRKRKLTKDTSLPTPNENTSSFKQGSDFDINSSIEEIQRRGHSNNAVTGINKEKKKKNVTDMPSSQRKLRQASSRRVNTASDSSTDNKINNTLKGIDVEGREHTKDAESAIIKGKKEKIVTDVSSVAKQKLTSEAQAKSGVVSNSCNDCNINTTGENESTLRSLGESKSKEGSIPKDSISNGRKRKIVTDTASSVTKQNLASEVHTVSDEVSADSSNDSNINSSSEESKGKAQIILEHSNFKGKKRKILTDMPTSVTKQNLVSEIQTKSDEKTSDCNINNFSNDCNINSSSEESKNNGRTLSDSIAKGKKRKNDTGMSSSMIKQKRASSSTDSSEDCEINTSLEENKSKEQEFSEESEFAIINDEREKEVITDTSSKTEQILAFNQRVSTSADCCDDFNINSSLEEVQSKGQELSMDSEVINEGKNIIKDMSSTTEQKHSSDKWESTSADTHDEFNVNRSLDEIQSVNQELSKDCSTDINSVSQVIDSQYLTDSYSKIAKNLTTENKYSALRNKTFLIAKTDHATRKCPAKKETKKLKITLAFEREISDVTNSEDKLRGKLECLESKRPELPQVQINKGNAIDSCDSSVDSSSLEKYHNESHSPGHSVHSDTEESRNIKSKTQNSEGSSSEFTSENSASLKEKIINIHSAMVKNDNSTSSSDIRISSTFTNPGQIESKTLSFSVQNKLNLCEESSKDSSAELKGSFTKTTDTPVSSNDLKPESLHKCVTHPSFDKEVPSSPFMKSINLRPSKKKSTEGSRSLETNNRREGSASSQYNVTYMEQSNGEPMKQQPNEKCEILAQGESKSSNRNLPVQITKSPFKFDVSLTVSEALKSTKLASMPSHKAQMANYLLKQLSLDQASKKNNEIRSEVSQPDLNKLEKAKSDPTLCPTYDFCKENTFGKKNNEPENVPKVTSSTSNKETSGEHTFKIPNKAAPRAKKKSPGTKSATFLKPKTNENHIYLQRMVSNLKGKSKLTKLFLTGSIPRRITPAQLLRIASNRNEKRIPLPSHDQLRQTTVQNPIISRTSNFKHVTCNKTVEPIQRALHLKDASSVNSHILSQSYILSNKEQTRNEINSSVLNKSALYLARPVKEQNVVHYKQDNITSNYNPQKSSVTCNHEKSVKEGCDEEVSRSKENKMKSQPIPGSLRPSNCINNVTSLKSNSSSDIAGSTTVKNKSESIVDRNPSRVQCESIDCKCKNSDHIIKQIPDSNNSISNSALQPLGSSSKSVVPKDDNDKKSENTKGEKVNKKDNVDTKIKISTPPKEYDQSDTWNNLKHSSGINKADKFFCSENSNLDRLHKQIHGTDSVNTTKTVSSESSPQNKNFILQNTREIAKPSKEHDVIESQTLQSDDSKPKFQNNISNEITLDDRCTAKLKSASTPNEDDTANSSKLNPPLKPQNENSLSNGQNKTIPMNNAPVRENLNGPESPVILQDVSQNKSKLTAQVYELVSQLRNLDKTTNDALNNYKQSNNNEEVNRNLRGMIPREGLNFMTDPDRPPEWFLKFIASFRKQELWRLHQMFKIHDLLMRMESAKINLIEKLYEEIKETEGIGDGNA